MTNDNDVALPQALTDFVFDLYDSVTLSQLMEEQTKLYEVDFKDLSQKYCSGQPWPSPKAIASECNGDPLFLAIYRELTQRQYHAVSKLSLRDRIEGWQVYRELFDEILEASNFYLLPCWIFDIMNEFVYQFQGFCQSRTAVYASARKMGILQPDGSVSESEGFQYKTLFENFKLLQETDAWDVAEIYSYFHRLGSLGWKADAPAAFLYLSAFTSVAQSRLECILGDYTSCLKALEPLSTHAGRKDPKDENSTLAQLVSGVLGARVSVAYHAGISFLMLRRYKDAIRTLNDICAYLERGLKTGLFRGGKGQDQYNKQFNRMASILAILNHICPTQGMIDEPVMKKIQDEFSSKIEGASNYEEFFQSPKFISTDPKTGNHRHQVTLFLKEMDRKSAGRKLRSYLKLYTSLPVEKLAKFYDLSVEEFMPLLFAYKHQMYQLECDESDPYSGGSLKSALDINYYMVHETVFVDEAEKERRSENYFLHATEQAIEIRQNVISIDTTM